MGNTLHGRQTPRSIRATPIAKNAASEPNREKGGLGSPSSSRSADARLKNELGKDQLLGKYDSLVGGEARTWFPVR